MFYILSLIKGLLVWLCQLPHLIWENSWLHEIQAGICQRLGPPASLSMPQQYLAGTFPSLWFGIREISLFHPWCREGVPPFYFCYWEGDGISDFTLLPSRRDLLFKVIMCLLLIFCPKKKLRDSCLRLSSVLTWWVPDKEGLLRSS